MSNEQQPPYSMPISAMGVPVINLDGTPSNGTAPCLALYLLPKHEGKLSLNSIVVICPGGGYGFLANDHEGAQVARWFNARGVSAVVLHYRLGPEHHYPVQLDEANKAVRIVRDKADEWGIDPNRVGIMGFSAGGHLAASAATLGADCPDNRPDFLILGYPVITMQESYTHMGSRENLVGRNPEAMLINLLSTELQVTAKTPPTFIFHTNNDNGVPVENSMMFYSALRKAGVEAELHIYERGPHGVGLCLQDPVLGTWPLLLERWLGLNGYLN